MHRTKDRVFIVPNIDQVPVPFKMFISFPPTPSYCALSLVIFEAGIKIAFLYDVSAVLFSTDFFFAFFYNYNTYSEYGYSCYFCNTNISTAT